jgi:hypothetical protein
MRNVGTFRFLVWWRGTLQRCVFPLTITRNLKNNRTPPTPSRPAPLRWATSLHIVPTMEKNKACQAVWRALWAMWAMCKIPQWRLTCQVRFEWHVCEYIYIYIIYIRCVVINVSRSYYVKGTTELDNLIGSKWDVYEKTWMTLRNYFLRTGVEHHYMCMHMSRHLHRMGSCVPPAAYAKVCATMYVDIEYLLGKGLPLNST